MSGWGLEVSDPAMTVRLALTGLGFGLVIAQSADLHQLGGRGRQWNDGLPHHRYAPVGDDLRSRHPGGLGSGRFEVLAAGLRLPVRLSGETAAQTQQRVQEFEAGVTETGLTLFNELFLVAMAVSPVAILPAAQMP